MAAPLALTFVDPSHVLRDLPVAAGQKVADFGCGSGYFSLEFAKRVGADGSVHAFDVLPSALEAVASRAKTMGIQNITTKRVNLENADGSTLLAESVDWVVIKDMLFQNQKKEAILHEAARVLRPGGYMLIMEWSPEESLVGPGKELRIAPEKLQSMTEAAGFSLEKEIPVGGFHYAFLVKKK